MRRVTNFNLRGVPHEVMIVLKKEADRENTSVNLLILKLIEKGMGISREIEKPVYHDLDKLAGTWSDKQVKEFEKNTKEFEKIDKDIW